MTKLVSIKDRNFTGDPCSTHGIDSSKYIVWDRKNVGDVCFFTDLELKNAKNMKCKKRVAWLMEPRPLSPHVYNFIEQNHNVFDVVLTYDERLLNMGDKFKFCPWGSSWVQNYDGDLTKKNLISTVASSKRHLEGHKLRHKVISEMPFIDAYGSNYRKLSSNSGMSKVEALADYYYHVCIENCRIKNYFTEKLIDCFVTKTIPIYWGCTNISDFFNTDSIIEFKNMQELVDKIFDISMVIDDKVKISIEDNYNRAQKYLITEDWIYENYPELF